MTTRVKEVEASVLATFKEEIPSIYFSHRTDKDYEAFCENAAYMYRQLFKFPPEMFRDRTLIDFGAGTGENTVYLASWGARCTLVEMNDDAQKISKDVFRKYTTNFDDHRFILSSIFDYAGTEQYDIAHSRGVLSHTDDRERAFATLARSVRPGGYLIFGDPNKAGGFQNMLQRYIVYRFAKTPDAMVDIAEKLFKDDIDRSQKFLPRTRRAIIFDRWVVQQQKDPSVAEVMKWFDDNGLILYSSHPMALLPFFGDSIYHQPKCHPQRFKDVGVLSEAIWMMQDQGDAIDVPRMLEPLAEVSARQSALVDYMSNTSATTVLDGAEVGKRVDGYVRAFDDLRLTRVISDRMRVMLDEVKSMFDVLETNDVDRMAAFLKTTRQLFRGAVGVRHVDYIGYKRP